MPAYVLHCRYILEVFCPECSPYFRLQIELMVIGVCTLAAYCHALTFLIYFTITAILVIVLVLIGSFIPCDLTANVASLFIVGVLIFLYSIYVLMIFMTIDSGDGFFISFAVLVLVIVCMVKKYLLNSVLPLIISFPVYHVPCPTNSRLAIRRTIFHRWTLCRDRPFLSLLHYLDAFLLFGLVTS